MAAKTPVFGRIENPGSLNLGPFKFTIAGTRHDPQDGTNKEVTFEFTAKGVRPFYVHMDMVRAAAAEDGTLSAAALIDFVELALLNDDERARWRETLESPDILFQGTMLGEVSDWLTEQYAARPTQPASASRSGASPGGRRSSAAAGGRAGATSAGSRRGKRST